MEKINGFGVVDGMDMTFPKEPKYGKMLRNISLAFEWPKILWHYYFFFSGICIAFRRISQHNQHYIDLFCSLLDCVVYFPFLIRFVRFSPLISSLACSWCNICDRYFNKFSHNICEWSGWGCFASWTNCRPLLERMVSYRFSCGNTIWFTASQQWHGRGKQWICVRLAIVFVICFVFFFGSVLAIFIVDLINL